MSKLRSLNTLLISTVILLFLVFPAYADILFSDSFNRPDGLVTNEYAFFNPNGPGAVKSPDWQMTSGSLFISGGMGWTGHPDDRGPNASSSNGNHSNVFRLDTKRNDFGDVEVSFSLLNQGLYPSASTPPRDWDGNHIFLRYQSEEHLYYASINRRDNTVILKKKIPGGPSNGGTYYNLSPSIRYEVPYNKWQSVKATVQNDSNGSVHIKLYADGRLLVSATDNGSLGGSPIRKAGRVGLRGDNASLKFRNFTVSSLTPTATPPPPVAETPRPAPPAPVETAGPPAISSTTISNLSETATTIQWDTAKAADSQVEYGLGAPYKDAGMAVSSATALTTHHRLVLKDLKPDTLYHYQVKSKDASGTLSTSGDLTFTTLGGPANSDPLLDDANVKANAKFLSPALADGINDVAQFGPGAKEVSIFDVQGRPVFHESKQGSTRIVWNCKDDRGRIVESGIYIAKIKKLNSETVYQSFAVVK